MALCILDNWRTKKEVPSPTLFWLSHLTSGSRWIRIEEFYKRIIRRRVHCEGGVMPIEPTYALWTGWWQLHQTGHWLAREKESWIVGAKCRITRQAERFRHRIIQFLIIEEERYKGSCPDLFFPVFVIVYFFVFKWSVAFLNAIEEGAVLRSNSPTQGYRFAPAGQKRAYSPFAIPYWDTFVLVFQ